MEIFICLAFAVTKNLLNWNLLSDIRSHLCFYLNNVVSTAQFAVYYNIEYKDTWIMNCKGGNGGGIVVYFKHLDWIG
jgi:hypothetical protein